MPCICWRVQGFYFARRRISLIQAFTARFVSYTANAAKQCTELCRGFSGDCARSTVHNTKPTQAAIIPLAPRWSVSQRRSTSKTYQNQRHARTMCRPAQPPYYNNVYKGARVRPLLWLHARRCSISQTMPARQGQLLPSVNHWQVLHPAHLLGGVSVSTCTGSARRLAIWHRVSGQGAPAGTFYPAEQSSSRGRGGRRGTIDGYRRISFLAFVR